MKLLEDLRFTHNYWKILLPLIFMIFDFITGYYNAWKKSDVSSSKMRDGIGKKLAEIVYIISAMLIDLAFGTKAVSVCFSIYIIYMELVSIAENCNKLGMPLPAKIKSKFEKIDKEIKKGSE